MLPLSALFPFLGGDIDHLGSFGQRARKSGNLSFGRWRVISSPLLVTFIGVFSFSILSALSMSSQDFRVDLSICVNHRPATKNSRKDFGHLTSE